MLPVGRLIPLPPEDTARRRGNSASINIFCNVQLLTLINEKMRFMPQNGPLRVRESEKEQKTECRDEFDNIYIMYVSHLKSDIIHNSPNNFDEN